MSLGQTLSTYFLIPGLLLPLISILLYKALRKNSQITISVKDEPRLHTTSQLISLNQRVKLRF